MCFATYGCCHSCGLASYGYNFFCKQPNNQTCYQYIPTPIKELDKRRQLEEEEGIHIVDAAAAPLEDISVDDVNTHNLEAVTDTNVPKEKDDQQSKYFFQ